MNLDTMAQEPKTIFNDARKQPLLSKKEEYALGYAIRDHDDTDALQKLTAAHVRLAISHARKYSNIDPQDAEGLAMEGLMEAARKFDPDKGFRFATYAMQWMRAKINEQLVRQSSIVKSGTTPAEKAVFFNRSFVMGMLMQSHGVEDIAQFTDIHWEEATRLINEGDTKKKYHKPRKGRFSVKEVKSALLRMHYGDYRLDAPLTAEDGQSASWGDYLEDETPDVSEMLEDQGEEEWRRGVLVEAFNILNDRERDMFVRRFLNEKPETLEAISGDYDVSKERVRQIVNKAAEKIRKRSLEIVTDRFGASSAEAGLIRNALEHDKNFKL